MRRLLKGLLIPALTLAILSAATELGLRLAFARSLDFGMEMWKYAVILKRPVPDPRLSFVHVSLGHAFLMGAEVAINSQGLRDKEYTLTKPAGTYRIMMLGDSTTFGWGVPADATVAKILERQLNAADFGRSFEVLNAGVGNYGTVQEVTYYLQRGLAFHPDLVVLEYFINDAEPVPRETKSFLRDQSYFAAFALSRADGILRVAGQRPDWRAYYASLYEATQPGWLDAKRALADLAKQTKEDGTGVLVALLPELHQIEGEYPFAREHALVRAAATTAGLPTLELIEGLRHHGPESRLWVTPLDTHPNRKANELIAAQLMAWIMHRREDR
jgi:lysophospholipase L1-like esterase